MSALVVVAAGPGSSLQDTGRIGWLRHGVSRAGAFDRRYQAAANILVGNDPGLACVEMTLAGDSYRLDAESALVAFAGRFRLRIDGEDAAPFRAHLLHRGQTLSVGPAEGEVRGYLAIAGGFDLAPVLGSLSTHVRTGIGPLGGRALRAGERLPLHQARAPARPPLAIDPALLVRPPAALRVMLGPQDGHFTPEGIATLFGARFRVTADADRMGYRLAGPPIAHALGYNIVSDGIPPGAIQVPGDGQPILLGPDRQTTGGYPKIGCIIGPDLGLLAQASPGQELTFRQVGIEEATAAELAERRFIAGLAGRMRPAGAAGLDSGLLLEANLIDGVIDMNAPEWRGGNEEAGQ
ncbi:MAG: biotin-dependent carboxyltransferase family protein [Alphaproteobacteria bacterium]|nr:biotin-dependent carboxyltransferase family protein [Alphaproteobacteria bacterium]